MKENNDVLLAEVREANSNFTIKDATASPGPLGLSAFGICTVLLSLINAGIIEMDSMILSMGLFYGGLTQIMVGLMERRKGNTFGLVAFTSYGIFWVSFVAINVLPGLGWMQPASEGGMIAYLVMWCLFSTMLFIATLKLPRLLQFLFATVVLLFVILIVGSATGNASIIRFAGYEGILCGLTSLYASAAFLLNEMYGRTVLPIGA
jgi:uncharacterized protein